MTIVGEIWEEAYSELEEKLEKQKKLFTSKLERWLELLESDGINSKNMVACDIQHILEEVNK